MVTERTSSRADPLRSTRQLSATQKPTLVYFHRAMRARSQRRAPRSDWVVGGRTQEKKCGTLGEDSSARPVNLVCSHFICTDPCFLTSPSLFNCALLTGSPQQHPRNPATPHALSGTRPDPRPQGRSQPGAGVSRVATLLLYIPYHAEPQLAGEPHRADLCSDG